MNYIKNIYKYLKKSNFLNFIEKKVKNYSPFNSFIILV